MLYFLMCSWLSCCEIQNTGSGGRWPSVKRRGWSGLVVWQLKKLLPARILSCWWTWFKTVDFPLEISSKKQTTKTNLEKPCICFNYECILGYHKVQTGHRCRADSRSTTCPFRIFFVFFEFCFFGMFLYVYGNSTWSMAIVHVLWPYIMHGLWP